MPKARKSQNGLVCLVSSEMRSHHICRQPAKSCPQTSPQEHAQATCVWRSMFVTSAGEANPPCICLRLPSSLHTFCLKARHNSVQGFTNLCKRLRSVACSFMPTPVCLVPQRPEHAARACRAVLQKSTTRRRTSAVPSCNTGRHPRLSGITAG